MRPILDVRAVNHYHHPTIALHAAPSAQFRNGLVRRQIDFRLPATMQTCRPVSRRRQVWMLAEVLRFLTNSFDQRRLASLSVIAHGGKERVEQFHLAALNRHNARPVGLLSGIQARA